MTCRSCGAEITWTRTGTDRAMPLDPHPHPDGNVLIEGGTCTVLGPLEVELHRDQPRYRSHFATCPNAADHRSAR